MLRGKAALLGGLGGPSIHYLSTPRQASLTLWSGRLGVGATVQTVAKSDTTGY